MGSSFEKRRLNVEGRSGDRQRRVPARRVPLQGCSNMRDIGGYSAQSRQRVRFGQVFRAPSLGAFTDADLPCFVALGLRTVVNLRGVTESARTPSRLPSFAPGVVRLPIERSTRLCGTSWLPVAPLARTS